MSKINKIVTNYPVSLTNEEVENLSLTLSAVRTAGGGGGGGEGKIYHGEGFVTVNNTSNAISLTTEANEKLNQPIPTKVSDLSDSANYQTVAGMSDYSTKDVADTLYAPISVTGDVDTLKASSGDWDQVSAKLDTTEFRTVSSEITAMIPSTDNLATKEEVQFVSAGVDYVSAHAITAHQSLDDYYTKTQVDSTFASATQLNNYLTTAQYQTDSATFALKTEIPTTVAQLTDSENYYLKTETSGISELNTAFGNKQDNLTQEQLSAISSVSSIKGTILTGDSNILTTSAEVGNNIKWTLQLTAQPVVTDTTLSGHNGIVAVKDSSVSSQWNISIAQAYKEEIEAVSSKLTKADADTYYAPISVTGDVDTLKSSSGDWDKVSDKLDITAFSTVSSNFLTAHQSLDNYYTKTQVDSTFASATQLNNYLTTATYATDSATFVTSSNSTITGTKQYALTTAGWAEVSTPTIPDITANNGISADGFSIGLTNTAIGAITSVSSKVDIPDTSLVDKYLALRTDNAGNVSGWVDLKDNFYSKTEATGTFVATANIDTTTLSGDGKSVSTKLGVKTDVIATTDYVNSSFLPTSGGTVSGQLEVHGGSNFDSQFIKLTREGNSCGARIGLGSDTTNGTLALKTFNGQGQNTVQVNIKHNTNNNELIQVQKGGSEVGFLIPAVTATTTAGLTNDGILHIILES